MASPDFYFEKKTWKKGFSWVVGIDEVGRGSLAGPVVVGAAIVKSFQDQLEILKLGIDDSKKLRSRQREQLVRKIQKYFVTGIGSATVAEVNRKGIVRATHTAARRAIDGILTKRDFFFLIDGRPIRYLMGGKYRQLAIIDGDQKSISIAAASIVAKVYRDRLMRKLARNFPQYKWGRNKGYGTKAHCEALLQYGSCCYHRTLFIDGIVKREDVM